MSSSTAKRHKGQDDEAGARRLSLEPETRREPKTARELEELEADEDVGAWVHDRQSDWGSLLADLSRPDENATLRVHDRTHLEFLLDYDLRSSARSETFEWEAYFFAPESLRLSSRTYDKQDLYSDLQSYVRFAVPETQFSDLCGAALDRVRDAIASKDERAILRELRLYACVVRAAGVDARRSILSGLDVATPSIVPPAPGESTSPPSRRAIALAAADRMIGDVAKIGASLRTALEPGRSMPDPVATAVQWIDEDVSRLLETLMANLSFGLREARATDSLVLKAEQAAVAEARYRDRAGLDGIGHVGMPSREAEHLEFRRHVLKRFTSSVLWLEPEIKTASTWVLHFFYAIAASVAMAFATAAALWSPSGLTTGTAGTFLHADFFKWAVVVILAYAAKDRIKALLQTIFNDVVARHFPDRSWRIRDASKKNELAIMEEQSGFIPFEELPREVLDVRRATRVSALEEEARPETVLYHKKTVVVDRALVRSLEPRYDAITEVYRFDLRRWLAHTDDPKRQFAFADPERGVVARASAPRVYNLGIVYRLKRANDASDDGKWRRVRVVVTRKGIRRIESIS
ncbi:MAG: hypothetical protein K1X94_08240 [Sandaracinaceae bacterium]|nr:hypothetical protein [Sandaracinaceae bacterium]